MTENRSLPVVVVGAGPIGLAAAAHLQARDIPFLVLERGDGPGSAVQEWGHVRLFSPWSELVDPAARRLLEETGWIAADTDSYPTGQDWVELYLRPLAAALGPSVRYGQEVTGIARQDRDLVVDSGRDTASFTVVTSGDGGEQSIGARAVIDASGTWTVPNPLGGNGLPALGEHDHSDRVSYRVPDLGLDTVRERYTGKHVVVAGTGASAKTALIGLSRLPGTRVSWFVRRGDVGDAFGSEDDQLAERGALGARARHAAGSDQVTIVTGFRAAAVVPSGYRVDVVASDGRTVTDVDEVLALTGFRPDLDFLSEVRLDLDPRLQAPRALAPLIDPNVHSCGSVSPHGVTVLAQPDEGVYLVGMKSYGRAPSFLALTGFEQVRSVVAAIAGDRAAAEAVELVLPETGVCGGAGDFDDSPAGTCCGSSTVEAPGLLQIGTR